MSNYLFMYILSKRLPLSKSSAYAIVPSNRFVRLPACSVEAAKLSAKPSPSRDVNSISFGVTLELDSVGDGPASYKTMPKQIIAKAA